MNIHDNHGRVIGQIEHFRTTDGRSVNVNTQINSYNGRVTSQTVTVARPNGKVNTTTTVNGRLLP